MEAQSIMARHMVHMEILKLQGSRTIIQLVDLQDTRFGIGCKVLQLQDIGVGSS